MSFEISVITCSHNPRPDYIAKVLDALKNQTLENSRWEYLLIDNACDEPLASRIDLSWHPNARHIREDQLGLTPARLRGIQEATGEILIFVDDDNVLDADYLERTLEVATTHPTVGAWGGQRVPEFETKTTTLVRRHWSHLALAEFETDKWSNQPDVGETMPNGAGLCVRKSVADFYVDLHRRGRRSFIMDRTGGSLVSGGDLDLAICACDIGLGIGLFASLKLTHLIPAARLTEDYLLRLTEGISYSAVILKSFRPNGSDVQRTWTTKTADFLRYLRKNGHEKRIYRAYRRGQERAMKDLASLKSG